MTEHASLTGLVVVITGGARGIGLATVELHARRHQPGLPGERRARVTFLQVAEDLPGALRVCALGSELELVEHGRGLGRLVALPPLPAVQAGIHRQCGDQRPGD